MSRHLSSDVKVILRGIQIVSREALKLQEKEYREVWENSSIRGILAESVTKAAKNTKKDLSLMQGDVSKLTLETVHRTRMVIEGLKALCIEPKGTHFNKSDTGESMVKPSATDDHDQKHREKTTHMLEEYSQNSYKLHESAEKNSVQMKTEDPPVTVLEKPSTSETLIKTRPKVKQMLSATAKQRAVPASRISRLISFGSLAAGLGVGTVAEASRRALGINKNVKVGSTLDSAFLSEANAERIVNTLCKVRGAALKIGQILSIQDNTIISPQLQKAFERVRQSADFMPEWQVKQVLNSELGSDWRSKVATFEYKPFAAASIGQVHLATLHNGTSVAMKIQYPGVARGIESDIDNLVSIMNVWNMFPQGLFIDNLVEVAKKELSWEVDYEREAECTKKFKTLLEPYPEYIVPSVIDELCTKQIFTSELVEGMPVDQCVTLDQDTRDHICYSIMKLCLKELFEFRYMQTDPNWSNFFYDPEAKKVALLDFGATRAYEKTFMDMYVQVIKSAADGNKDSVLKISREMGFLTGYESKLMEQAHVETVMILGEVFRSDRPFDFGSQNTTRRVQHLVPTMIQHRLCPPPEQIYSLHRKLSGVFLLCAKLRVSISCRPLLEDVWSKYHFGEIPDTDINK